MAAPRREPREPKQSRSKDTVEVLLDAAERILRAEGPAALTTKHVAATAGVGVGTLYQYYSDKDAIVTALERRMWARSLDVVRDALATVRGEPLHVVIGAVVSAAVDHLWPAASLHGWSLPTQQNPQEDLRDVTRMAVEMVAAALQSYGDVVRPTNTRLAASFAIHAVTNLVRVAARDFPELIQSGEVTKDLTRMITVYLVGEYLKFRSAQCVG